MLRGYRCVRLIDNTVYIHYEDTVYIPTILSNICKVRIAISQRSETAHGTLNLQRLRNRYGNFLPFAVLDI